MRLECFVIILVIFKVYLHLFVIVAVAYICVKRVSIATHKQL